MDEIATYLSDLLRAQAGTEKPDRWFSRLKYFFSWKFGTGWLKTYREFQEKYGPFKDYD